jgi:hypothetical protein
MECKRFLCRGSAVIRAGRNWNFQVGMGVEVANLGRQNDESDEKNKLKFETRNRKLK